MVHQMGVEDVDAGGGGGEDPGVPAVAAPYVGHDGVELDWGVRAHGEFEPGHVRHEGHCWKGGGGGGGSEGGGRGGGGEKAGMNSKSEHELV